MLQSLGSHQFPATLESKGVQVSLYRNDVQAASSPLS